MKPTYCVQETQTLRETLLYANAKLQYYFGTTSVLSLMNPQIYMVMLTLHILYYF